MGKGGAPEAAETDTITVRVPISFRKRGGRKTVTAPNGSQQLTALQSNADTALTKALARAFRWRKLIETGVHSTVAEIAAAEKVNPSYASRILRLTLLAPEIVEAILDRRGPNALSLDRLLRPFSVMWEQQRAALDVDAD